RDKSEPAPSSPFSWMPSPQHKPGPAVPASHRIVSSRRSGSPRFLFPFNCALLAQTLRSEVLRACSGRRGMFPHDYLLAVALLTSPPDSPEPVTAPDLFAALQPALQGLAVEWEILDPREVRYVLTRPEDFGSDLKLLRRRSQDLADAPPLGDGMR